jgi:hypothetical protein
MRAFGWVLLVSLFAGSLGVFAASATVLAQSPPAPETPPSSPAPDAAPPTRPADPAPNERTVPDTTAAPPATPAAAPSKDAAMDQARAYMEKGQALYMKGLFLDAANEFERAYGVQQASAFLFNAGVAYERYGDLTKSIEKFELYLTTSPKAEDKDKVAARVAALRDRLAKGETGPSGTAESKDMKGLLVVRSEPVGAKVTITRDNQLVATGPSPMAESLDQGRYSVTIEHPDYRAVNTNAEVTAGNVFVIAAGLSQGQFLGSLEVVTDVPGAEVYINDKALGVQGKTPFRTQLPVGQYKVWVAKAGYREETSNVEVELGRHVQVTQGLTRVDFGRLRVVANVRGAEVQVDGKKVGNAPGTFDVPSGSHTVTVSADDMKDWEQVVDVRRGKETPVRVRLRPSVSRTGAWITGVLAVAALGGGITLGLLSNSEKDAINADVKAGKLTSDDSRIGGILDGSPGALFALGADVAFGAAAILGGLSLYYFVRDPLPDSEGVVQEPRDWAVSPFFTPNAAGVSGSWSF